MYHVKWRFSEKVLFLIDWSVSEKNDNLHETKLRIFHKKLWWTFFLSKKATSAKNVWWVLSSPNHSDFLVVFLELLGCFCLSLNLLHFKCRWTSFLLSSTFLHRNSLYSGSNSSPLSPSQPHFKKELLGGLLLTKNRNRILWCYFWSDVKKSFTVSVLSIHIYVMKFATIFRGESFNVIILVLQFTTNGIKYLFWIFVCGVFVLT